MLAPLPKFVLRSSPKAPVTSELYAPMTFSWAGCMVLTLSDDVTKGETATVCAAV
jgi:hypothetical protein